MRNIQTALKLAPVEGDIGIEIELEGRGFPPVAPPAWRKEHDPSLRGEENAEYVLRQPVHADLVGGVLDNLAAHFKKHNTKLDSSYRAGVHIHVNVQQLTTTQLFNYIILFLIMEECLVDFCEKSRRGNHFCLRAKDAEYFILRLWDACKKNDLRILNDEDLRYSAMNITSLFKYGSVEFRCLESTTDFDKIRTWALMLHRLRQVATEYKDPVEIMDSVSGGGFDYFTRRIMGEWFPIINGQDGWKTKVRRGVLNSQDLAYSRAWSRVNLNIFKKDADFD